MRIYPFLYYKIKNNKKLRKKMKKVNLCIGLSDIHLGHENGLYETLEYCINKLIKDINDIKNKFELNRTFMILNGDIVSGTFVYRNQYLESQIQKNESIILGGAYLIHLIIDQIEETTGMQLKVFIVTGNHEGFFRPHPENFSLGISRRLNAYGHDTRYVSNHLILNMANGLLEDTYNICAFHSWGGADYSSASPSVVREMTRAHSQLATLKNIIIQRFLLGHTHWLEVDRYVLGVRFDVTGGFQAWDKTISNRESGMLYYLLDEDGEFKVQKISGLKKQLEEETQNLNSKNLRYIANLLDEGIKYEIEIGVLKEPEAGLELR